MKDISEEARSEKGCLLLTTRSHVGMIISLEA